MPKVIYQTLALNSATADFGVPHDFKTNVNPAINLDQNEEYYIAFDRISMSYSWYNIDDRNNEFYYDYKGTIYKVVLAPGNYSYEDIDSYLKTLILDTHSELKKEDLTIDISFNLSTLKVLVRLGADFKLDLQRANNRFCDLLGFEQVVLGDDRRYLSTKLPDITRGVDSLQVHCNLVGESILVGSNTSSDVIYQFSVENLPLSYAFTEYNRRLMWVPLNTRNINMIRVWITDTKNNHVILNGIHVSVFFVIGIQENF